MKKLRNPIAIVRNPVLKENKKPLIAMILIAVFMLLISVVDFSLIFFGGQVAFKISSIGYASSVLSIIPITWGICASLLMRTKKILFAKMPSYVICALLIIGYIFYYIALGNENVIRNILLLAVLILAVYPFIIATLTIEGRVYNRVFATIFTSILIMLSTFGAIVYCILNGAIILSMLFPALTYVELLIIVLVFNLEKPKKSKQTENKITH